MTKNEIEQIRDEAISATYACANEFNCTDADAAATKALVDRITALADFAMRGADVDGRLKEAAEIAGRCWQAFQQTKQAHERLSPEPFRPTEFGLDYDKAVYSRDCMNMILALDGRGNSDGSKA